MAVLVVTATWKTFRIELLFIVFLKTPNFLVPAFFPHRIFKFLLSSRMYSPSFNVFIDGFVAIATYNCGSIISSEYCHRKGYRSGRRRTTDSSFPCAVSVHISSGQFLCLLWKIASCVMSSWAVTGLISARLLFRVPLSLYLILPSLISPYRPKLVYDRNLVRVSMSFLSYYI